MCKNHSSYQINYHPKYPIIKHLYSPYLVYIELFGNAINNLNIEDVTSIDNFKKNLIDNLTDLGTDEETSNKIFESLASLYKDNENPL